MDKLVKDLVELSKYASKHPEFVQGGGGNCSVKFEGVMAIKTSGIFLESVLEKGGYVLIDIESRKPLQGQNLKPSLETHVHLLLGSFVIHTHPVLVGALVCAKQGKEVFGELFKGENCFWVGYSNPGEELGEKIADYIKDSNIDLSRKAAFFLENHGIFVSSSLKEDCISFHEKLIDKLRIFFNYDNLDFNLHVPSGIGYLTPDHVVYSSFDTKNLSFKQQVAVSELDVFSMRTHALIASKGWDVNYLSKESTEFIKSMDEEKYRQGLLNG